MRTFLATYCPTVDRRTFSVRTPISFRPTSASDTPVAPPVTDEGAMRLTVLAATSTRTGTARRSAGPAAGRAVGDVDRSVEHAAAMTASRSKVPLDERLIVAASGRWVGTRARELSGSRCARIGRHPGSSLAANAGRGRGPKLVQAWTRRWPPQMGCRNDARPASPASTPARYHADDGTETRHPPRLTPGEGRELHAPEQPGPSWVRLQGGEARLELGQDQGRPFRGSSGSRSCSARHAACASRRPVSG